MLAGSLNVSQAVVARVTKTTSLSTLASILRLADRAANAKPVIAELAERIARWFVLIILLIAGLVAVSGLAVGNQSWLSTVIAVFVVTCPCALSLATPLALTAGANAMIRQGVCVAQHHAIETMAAIQTVLFDKTGTLTTGDLGVKSITILATCQSTNAQRLLRRSNNSRPTPSATPLSEVSGTRQYRR